VINVLFACVHNAGRSQIAAALFNKYADPRKARAISAGTEPAMHVHPEVVDLMQARGVDLSTQVPQQLTPELAAGVQWLITMGCGAACPIVPGTHRDDWPIDDPKGKPAEQVGQIIDDIDARVRALLDSLGHTTSPDEQRRAADQ
jgi:arsenate reductase (thioredoxin)